MAKAAAKTTAARVPAGLGRDFTASGVTLTVLPAAYRTALRAPEASLGSLSKALGLTLPAAPKSSVTKGSRSVIWLGPDEWLVIDEDKDPQADCARAKALHAAVDVSHRNVGIAVTGMAAAATINSGCPQDLSLQVFPVGAVSRTILGKVEIVVFRTAEDSFRVECWRSFSDYVLTFLTDAARDAAL